MYPPPHPQGGYDKHWGGVPVPAPPPGIPISPRLQQQQYASPYPPAGMKGVRPPDGSIPWSTGLCHCCDDPANCLITCFCPCITFGQIAEIVDRGSTSCGASGAAYGLLGPTGLACLYSCFYRGRLRGQYNLQEAPTHDCLVHFCCECCALCQEYRELRNRGFDMGIGIYMGDGVVIHFTRGGEEIGTGTVFDQFLASSVPSVSDTPCEKCGDQSILINGVLSSCIDCFLCGGDLYLFHYSVSPAFFIAKVRGGTCTLAAADPADDVLHRAKYLLQNGFGTYNVFKNNCEDFAIYCKTGLLVVTSYSVGRSGQLATLMAAASAIVSSPLRFLTSSFGGLTVITGGMYCLNRVVSDVGIRRDVIKIAVENLVAGTNEDEAAATTETIRIDDES